MIVNITHILTANLEQFLITLTSLGMVAMSGLRFLALVHESKNNKGWRRPNLWWGAQGINDRATR